MALALALLAALQAPCDPGKRKQGEIAAETEPWFKGHAVECTLCADGSACRDGYERRASARRSFDAWRAGHAAAGCGVCAAAVGGPPVRCAAVDGQKQVLTSEAQAKHRQKDAKCEFDPARCEAWRAAAEEVKRTLDGWRKDHAGVCDRCAPDCDEWRKKAKEVVSRAEESLARHRERCGDCKAGGCDRAGVIKEDVARQRQTQWRSHAEICACSKGKR
ncbi:MAG TPA: hypothetical protein VF950_10760 [Planctomycetota bacterium]